MKKILIDNEYLTYTLEAEGSYKGFDLKVTHVIYKEKGKGFSSDFIINGWRCGYVKVEDIMDRIPFDENKSQIDWFLENIECDREIDFINVLPHIDPDNKYIGFACDHLFYTVDKCTTIYCIKECEKIIDQLIDFINNK